MGKHGRRVENAVACDAARYVEGFGRGVAHHEVLFEGLGVFEERVELAVGHIAVDLIAEQHLPSLQNNIGNFVHLILTPNPASRIIGIDQHHHLHILPRHHLLQLIKINLEPPILHQQLRLIAFSILNFRSIDEHVVGRGEEDDGLARRSVQAEAQGEELCEAVRFDDSVVWDHAVVVGFDVV